MRGSPVIRYARGHSRFTSLTLAVLLMLACTAWGKDHHLNDPTDQRAANSVLRNLLASPLGKTMPRLKYRVILLKKVAPNAFSERNGTVYVTEGLLPAFEGDQGVWAAVIGHELGHVLLAHPGDLPRFQATLKHAYGKARAKGFDHGPPPWPNIHLGEDLAKPRSPKEQEYQADFIGLMLMAEAGYQPGYSLILEKRLLFGLGSEPRFVSMFSHHPRMESREERTMRFSEIAMDIFRSRWPDAEKSPGGNLPPYGTIGPWSFEQDDGGTQLVFHVAFEVHRSEGMKIRVAAFFLDGDLRPRASESPYRATDGSLVVNRFLAGAESKSSQVTLEVPARALIARRRHLLAVVFLMANGRPLDIATRHVDLSGPMRLAK